MKVCVDEEGCAISGRRPRRCIFLFSCPDGRFSFDLFSSMAPVKRYDTLACFARVNLDAECERGEACCLSVYPSREFQKHLCIRYLGMYIISFSNLSKHICTRGTDSSNSHIFLLFREERSVVNHRDLQKEIIGTDSETKPLTFVSPLAHFLLEDS